MLHLEGVLRDDRCSVIGIRSTLVPFQYIMILDEKLTGMIRFKNVDKLYCGDYVIHLDLFLMFRIGIYE